VSIIESRLNCACVGTVGQMAIFYREQPDPEKRKIALPS
jgi:RNA-binding protein YhbY